MNGKARKGIIIYSYLEMGIHRLFSFQSYNPDSITQSYSTIYFCNSKKQTTGYFHVNIFQLEKCWELIISITQIAGAIYFYDSIIFGLKKCWELFIFITLYFRS